MSNDSDSSDGSSELTTGWTMVSSHGDAESSDDGGSDVYLVGFDESRPTLEFGPVKESPNSADREVYDTVETVAMESVATETIATEKIPSESIAMETTDAETNNADVASPICLEPSESDLSNRQESRGASIQVSHRELDGEVEENAVAGAAAGVAAAGADDEEDGVAEEKEIEDDDEDPEAVVRKFHMAIDASLQPAGMRRRRQSSPHIEDDDALPPDPDDRCESDISGVVDDDTDLSSASSIEDLPLEVGNVRRSYRHQPNPTVNAILTSVAITALFFAFGIGFGHYMGSNREFTLRQQLLSHMKSLQNDYLTCFNYMEKLEAKLRITSDVDQRVMTVSSIWEQKYGELVLEKTKLEYELQKFKNLSNSSTNLSQACQQRLELEMEVSRLLLARVEELKKDFTGSGHENLRESHSGSKTGITSKTADGGVSFESCKSCFSQIWSQFDVLQHLKLDTCRIELNSVRQMSEKDLSSERGTVVELRNQVNQQVSEIADLKAVILNQRYSQHPGNMNILKSNSSNDVQNVNSQESSNALVEESKSPLGSTQTENDTRHESIDPSDHIVAESPNENKLLNNFSIKSEIALEAGGESPEPSKMEPSKMEPSKTLSDVGSKFLELMQIMTDASKSSHSPPQIDKSSLSYSEEMRLSVEGIRNITADGTDLASLPIYFTFERFLATSEVKSNQTELDSSLDMKLIKERFKSFQICFRQVKESLSEKSVNEILIQNWSHLWEEIENRSDTIRKSNFSDCSRFLELMSNNTSISAKDTRSTRSRLLVEKIKVSYDKLLNTLMHALKTIDQLSEKEMDSGLDEISIALDVEKWSKKMIAEWNSIKSLRFNKNGGRGSKCCMGRKCKNKKRCRKVVDNRKINDDQNRTQGAFADSTSANKPKQNFESKSEHKQTETKTNNQKYEEFWKWNHFDPDDFLQEGFFEGNQRKWRKYQKQLRKLQGRLQKLNEVIFMSMDDDDVEDIYEDLENFDDEIDNVRELPEQKRTWLTCQLRWWKSRLHRKHRDEDLVKGCGRQLMHWQLQVICNPCGKEQRDCSLLGSAVQHACDSLRQTQGSGRAMDSTCGTVENNFYKNIFAKPGFSGAEDVSETVESELFENATIGPAEEKELGSFLEYKKPNRMFWDLIFTESRHFKKACPGVGSFDRSSSLPSTKTISIDKDGRHDEDGLCST